MDYPNQMRFEIYRQDSREAQMQLDLLEAHHKAAVREFNKKMTELAVIERELAFEQARMVRNDYDAEEHRQRINVLTEKIAIFTMPTPIDHELYRIRRGLLQHKLRETNQLNATLLAWEAEQYVSRQLN